MNVAIAVPGDPERARAVLARGRSIASHFGLQWIAVRILRSPREEKKPLVDLVDALGGCLVCAESRDIATGLIEVSRREQSRLLVLGASHRPRFLRWLRRGVTEQILRAKRPFDVIVTGARD